MQGWTSIEGYGNIDSCDVYQDYTKQPGMIIKESLTVFMFQTKH